MFCLTKMCYVCLEEKDKSLININSPLSVNKDIIHIIGCPPFNLAWLKTKRIILICEECCRRLRETYQLLTMCLKNSAVLQGYMDKLNTESISSTDIEAELYVHLNNKHNDINETIREIKVEDEEIYTAEKGPMFDEAENEFMNVEDYFVKDEDTWKREAEDDEEEHPMNDTKDTDADSDSSEFPSEMNLEKEEMYTFERGPLIEDTEDVSGNIEDSFVREEDDKEESPMENNATECSDNETNSEISVTDNAHDTDTDTDSDSSTQVHTTNKKQPTTAAEKSHTCLTCNKTFTRKTSLQVHTRVHTGKKPYQCATCEKCFNRNSNLKRHIRIHTGEKPYECSTCNKYFKMREHLKSHVRTHTDEKPYECSTCKKSFKTFGNLKSHVRTHTGEKPHECSECTKRFREQSHLVTHMRVHTGEKPYECSECRKCFMTGGNLMRHMRVHTGEES